MGAYDLSQKLIFGKKNCYMINKSHGLGTRLESCKKMAYYLFFFRRFWVEERPVIRRPLHTKSDTAIVASRVSFEVARRVLVLDGMGRVMADDGCKLARFS